MIKDEQVDTALLADMTGFLAECNVPPSAVDPRIKTTPPLNENGLFLATEDDPADECTAATATSSRGEGQVV